ncbi:putative membrane protein [Hyphomonas neptunium ATCC 15444]|uniref:Tryptophan-rich sensory protein n=2 Tax=Hyphomonas TaxID=85 RepID=A0A059G143_9PROT|nr:MULTISPECIES: hypothetical protein [Hyphomonas]ABI78387.1 putative membrane protein [Hyphomonas neptunium ATCC 15444]KCZ96461.1 hypothetical protein HHI_02240 [Hyphomonas hirschiana VP5]
MNNRLFPLLIFLLGVAQPLAGALAPAFGIGTPIGDATAGSAAPEQPLPAFFSIWGVIFAAYTALGVAGLWRPDQWPAPLGLPLVLAGAGNIIWMLSAQLIGSQPLDFVLLAPILVCAWWAAREAEALRGTRSLSVYLGDAASGLLAGWISVAAAISIPLTVRSLTWLEPTDFPWPMFWSTILTAALLAWIFASRISGSLWYFVAAGWGLLGIAFHNWLETGMHLIGHFTAGCLILLLTLRLTRGAKAGKRAA